MLRPINHSFRPVDQGSEEQPYHVNCITCSSSSSVVGFGDIFSRREQWKNSTVEAITPSSLCWVVGWIGREFGKGFNTKNTHAHTRIEHPRIHIETTLNSIAAG